MYSSIESNTSLLLAFMLGYIATHVRLLSFCISCRLLAVVQADDTDGLCWQCDEFVLPLCGDRLDVVDHQLTVLRDQ